MLEEVCQAGGRNDTRVVVPRATKGEHLHNRPAREGFAIGPSCVSTMAGLVGEIAPEIRTVDAGVRTAAGYPLDLTFYQAGKGVTAASHIVKSGE